MTPEVINSVSASVPPLVFETSRAETPYSIRGTVFLVGYAGRAFVLTARHSLCPEDCPPICIFPTDASQKKIIPLKDVFFVPVDHVPDDFGDIAVIEMDMNKITDTEVGSAKLIDLDLASGDWLSKSEAAEFFVLGYPEEHSFVDYDLETITSRRWALHGQYAGESISDYCHMLEVSSIHNLTTFSGFSGGPVFAWIESPGNRGQIILCGMALRGTPAGGQIHFLDRSVLLDALNIKLKQI
ncbi:hypothetical protein BMS3Bbin14_00241 [bacterium BMS3Bbin14]|nr:hypothetical protein BMS3Bbin14_00241 [bacterium BMS3Bbin14]